MEHSYRSRKLNQRETKIEGDQGIVGTEGGENGQPELTSLLCNFNMGRNALEYVPPFSLCILPLDHNLLCLSLVLGSWRIGKEGEGNRGRKGT